MPTAVPSQPASTAVTSNPPLLGLALAGVKEMSVETHGKGQGWDTGWLWERLKAPRMQICCRWDFSSASTEKPPALSQSNWCLRHSSKGLSRVILNEFWVGIKRCLSGLRKRWQHLLWPVRGFYFLGQRSTWAEANTREKWVWGSLLFLWKKN